MRHSLIGKRRRSCTCRKGVLAISTASRSTTCIGALAPTADKRGESLVPAASVAAPMLLGAVELVGGRCVTIRSVEIGRGQRLAEPRRGALAGVGWFRAAK